MHTVDPSPRSRTAPGPRRFLCRVDDHYPFAYLRGLDVYRRADHSLWAHLRDGVLVCARTGAPIAYQAGSYFDDPHTETHLYYLVTSGTPPS